MNIEHFKWIEADQEFVYLQPDEGKIKFIISADGVELSNNRNINVLLSKGISNLKELIYREPKIKVSAYRQIEESIKEHNKVGSTTSLEMFKRQWLIKEMCMVEATDGHIRYSGIFDAEGFELNIYCNGIEFDTAEVISV